MEERASSALRVGPTVDPAGCLAIERSDLADKAIIVLTGEFDLAGVEAFEKASAEVASGASVILDLGGLSFLDSSGLRALVILNRRAQAEGWSLTLANPQPQVVRLLRLTRLDQLLTVVERSPLS